MATLSINSNFYLQNVQESPILNSYVSYDPQAGKVSNDRWNKVWVVATLVCAVAFTALAALAVGYATLYLEAELIIITLSVFFGLYPSAKIVQHLWSNALHYRKEAEIDQKLVEKMKNLDVQKVSQRLKDLNVKPGIEPDKLKSILARYEYLMELEQEHTDTACRLNLSANEAALIPLRIQGKTVEISPKDYCLEKVDFNNPKEVAIFQALQIERCRQETMWTEAALCHLKAAYLLKLIQDPYESRSIDSFGAFKNALHPLRLVARESNDPGAMIIFKNYTAHELRNKTTTALAREVFELKSASIFGI